MGFLLNFHEVRDSAWLEYILCYLKTKYNLVHLPELIRLYKNEDELKNICHISVDDGDISFYKVIYAVLKKHKIPVSIYVSPEVTINKVNYWFQEISGYDKQMLLKILSEVININVNDIKEFCMVDIFKCFTIDQIWEIINTYQKKYNPGKTHFQNMSVDQLREVENSGLVTIGAHSLRHPILANEEITLSKNEITSSINNLADILGHEIIYFSYPNGIPHLDFGQREMDIVKDCGCICSVSTESGSFNLRSDLLNIPRYGIMEGNGIDYVKTKLFFGSHWNKIMKLKTGNESVSRKKLFKLIRKSELRG